MRNKGNFIKGSVEILILHLLQDNDYYGSELSQMINHYSGEIIRIPEGSLYPALYKLSDKGYISEDKRLVGKRQTKVYYHLEDSGRIYLRELLEDYHRTHMGIQLILNRAPENNEE